ncbi:hypothetical protein [Ornithinibacillus bavariensis]|uniref:Uncharacterized protein n=1 Tax=Ornithinibacillus bavariensis TaxID=545502 RepID=A0A919XB78_9BACI|nr:hypothetical protein [Ornithinibacillus bavariensis]GIO28424.1 hypothetical protein J43TS3_30350 [Ornithinibacillus bavariensis]HAM81151.1 hypothetical protein [Ornithinibacillus sp.]
MGLALRKDNIQNGVARKDFEAALHVIGDRARLAEQKLTLKIDEEVQLSFLNQKKAIEQATVFVRELHVK